jgi:hypothetical protein
MPASCKQLPRFISALIFGAGIVTDSAVTQSYAANPSVLPVDVSLAQQERPGTTPAVYVLVTAGTNKFFFPLLEGFRMRNDISQGKVLLIKYDDTWTLTVRVLKPLEHGVTVDSTPYRDLVLRQFPSPKITEEFSATAANQSGPAFDLQWKVSTRTTASARVAFIPSNAGILEFSLLTTSDQFPKALPDFNRLLMSFRVATNGKVRIRPPPEGS